MRRRMSPKSHLFLLPVVVTAFLAPVPAQANPLFPGADPDVIEARGRYWIYPTYGRNSTFSVWSSPDLKEWEKGPEIFDLKTIPWLAELKRPRLGAWAPGITEKDGTFYLYYSVGPQSPGFPSVIGVATATAPDGPFQDSGKPLLTGGNGFEAIDAMVFRDPKTGSHYFYAGGSDGSRLRIFELDETLMSFKREIRTRTPEHFTEGPFMHLRNDTYYLSYSHGRFNGPDYSVHYATSTTPAGPWTYQGRILESDATRKGPGHHSFITTPDGDYIVYHRWESGDAGFPIKGERQIAIEKISYDTQGKVQRIKMTP